MNQARDLAMEQRDLSFAESQPDRAKHLSAEQVETYNREGFLKPFRICDDADVERNRRYFDDLLEKIRQMAPDRDAYAINGFQSRCRGIYDMATHPRILDLVEDLIGPDIVCWATHFFCKLPHDPKSVPWHQDASYWRLTPARTVTAWLAIDDADVENACMHVIPGTHRMGPLPWSDATEPSVLNQSLTDVDKLGEPVPIELQAGEISLHADMLAHGSRPNESDRRRCGLTIRYCPPTVRVLAPAWADNEILCRGEAPADTDWRFNPRPEVEDLSAFGKQPSIGGN